VAARSVRPASGSIGWALGVLALGRSAVAGVIVITAPPPPAHPAAAMQDRCSSPSAGLASTATHPAKDLCPTTGQARLGYDRARVLFARHTGWELHQLSPLGRHAPRRAGRPVAADHGQDPSLQPTHRHALRATGARGRHHLERDTSATKVANMNHHPR
jgi:hypothetical protein